MIEIFRGDTLNNFITVELVNNANFDVYKLIFQCGCIRKEYIEPVFPLSISLTKQESEKLDYDSTAYIAVENRKGEKLTADGMVSFIAKRRVVKDGTMC